MKVAVIGYSGSGKSTLAGKLGHLYGCPVQYLDRVNFEAGWKERDREEAREIAREFLEENRSKGWVIDGNYEKFYQKERLKEADLIVFMNFPRRICLYQAFKRFFQYRGKKRVCMADGCIEKIDPEFVWWILAKGRSRKYKERYREIQRAYGEKTLVIRNHKELKKSMICLADRSKKERPGVWKELQDGKNSQRKE